MTNENRFNLLINNISEYFIKKFNISISKDLSIEDLLGLKSVLSNVNNMLTYKTTLSFVNWLSQKRNFTTVQKDSIIQQIDSISPNANGYDVDISEPERILAEVKTTIPINNSKGFGSAQRKSIIKDLQKLSRPENSSALKFMVLLDNENVRDAFTKEKSFVKKLKDESLHTEVVINTTNFSYKNTIYVVFVHF